MKKGIELRVAAILIRDGKVLLARHEKKGQSYWVLPGGHVEPGETLAEALVREMREELRLDVAVGPLVIVHDFIKDGKRHVVNHDFLTDTSSAEFSVTAQGSLREARFFSPSEMRDVDLRPDLADLLARLIDAPPASTIYLGRL